MRKGEIAKGSSCTSSVLVYKWKVRPFESLFLSLSLHICSSRCCPSAPEVVARHRYGRPVDCWAVGVIMFILWVSISDYQSYSTSNTSYLTWVWLNIPSSVSLCMFPLCSLSGNPPFYDETEEENTDLHNRIIFCRIVAGDFEFDSPYWDDISPAGT